MQWISHYQLFLFDFDGLLVDTERLHYQAYLNMCANRGFSLTWSFDQYSKVAHHSATALQREIYLAFPALQQQEPDWRVLYKEKSTAFLDLISKTQVPLLPGVEKLLLALQQAGIKRSVVTHSATALITKVREHNPILNTIPNWITRDDYTHPKPDPECYQLAISKFADPKDNIIGFEDSPRGLAALLGTRAKPILICPPDSQYIQGVLEQHPQVTYYPSFLNIANIR